MGKVIKIREVGDPILNKKSENIDCTNIDKEILELIDDLIETLHYGTGVGIAAPQIGINKRIIVIEAKKEDIKYNDAEDIPLTIMINPYWEKLSEETDIQFEGCMSVPQIRGKVKRYKKIKLVYYNEKGEKIQREVSGFFARLIQHECDHLEGTIFIEKVEPGHSFATKEMITKFDLRNIEEEKSC